MPSEPAISSRRLSKIYDFNDPRSERLRRLVLGRAKTSYETLTALQDINLELAKGEVLGVLGRKGSGKSTLLQLICRMLPPSSGTLTVNGRIAALLGSDAGLIPQLTGRENVCLFAYVRGISKKEIKNELEHITYFSQSRDLIDKPVSTYPNDMYLRFAFSLATSFSPDIIVIDESMPLDNKDFLGDLLSRLKTMRAKGRVILLCSQSIYQVKELCTRAIWLEKGCIKASGTTGEVVNQYQTFLHQLEKNCANSSELSASTEYQIGESSAESKIDQPSASRSQVPLSGKRFTEEQRWRAVDATQVSQQSLLELFENAFGHALEPQIWRWKYRYAQTPGSVVLENNHPVAFSGGIPRQGWVFGEPHKLVQIGDVMVRPQARGVLTRKGPFFLSLQHYLSPRVGAGLHYTYAFGFPNARACRVGVKRGLYCTVDKIFEARWKAESDENSDASIISPVDISHPLWTHTVDRLWLKMRHDTQTVAVGERNGQWIKHRYVDKPFAEYMLYFVYEDNTKDTGFTDKDPIALIILTKRSPSAELELLDMVSAKSHAAYAISAAKCIAASSRSSALFAWATPSVLAWLENTMPEVRETEVAIPGCKVNSPDYAIQLKDKWWLMGGDTDFR